MDGKQVYENICRIAWGQGMTIHNLCYEAGLRPSVLSDLKFERNKSISDITAYKLANVLDCDPSDFYRVYTDPMPPKPMKASRLRVEYAAVADAMQDRPDVRKLMRVALKATPKQVSSVANLLESIVNGDL